MKFLSIFFRKPSERLTSSEIRDQRNIFLMESIKLRAALADIRNQGINSKSGTARAMARKAGEALS